MRGRPGQVHRTGPSLATHDQRRTKEKRTSEALVSLCSFEKERQNRKAMLIILRERAKYNMSKQNGLTVKSDHSPKKRK